MVEEEAMRRELEELFGVSLRVQRCPQCGKFFQLMWNDYSDVPRTLTIWDCPSGGVYSVEIRCAHCNFREEL